MNYIFTNTGSIVVSKAKKVALRNVGTTTVYWGWESTTSAGGDANQGIPLQPGSSAPGEGIILDGNDKMGTTIYLACTTSGSVNYSQML